MGRLVAGTIAGLAMDVELRKASGGKVGLEHLLKEMYREFGHKGKAYEHADIVRIGKAVGGIDLDPLLTRIVASSKAPDLGPLASLAPAPPGAADLEPVILAALDALAATPWRGTVNALTLGNVTLTEVTSVPGEPAAAEAWVGWRDQRRYGFLAIGGELWQRLAGDAAWQARAGDAPPCFRRTCDAAGLADIAWRVREAAGTFRDLDAPDRFVWLRGFTNDNAD